MLGLKNCFRDYRDYDYEVLAHLYLTLVCLLKYTAIYYKVSERNVIEQSQYSCVMCGFFTTCMFLEAYPLGCHRY